MTFVPNFPPSILRKVGDDESADGKKKTKEDFKKMKEVEEARKLAVMPAMKDEEGRDINPHIPQYIMQTPWYFGSLQPTLRHQRMQDEAKREQVSDTMKGSTALNNWYKRGIPLGQNRAKKYRDGACENCGSISHSRKNCLERPRKIGAKYSGIDIGLDDYNQSELSLTYDAKRDRWNGYDPREHQRQIAEFQRFEEARKLVKAKKMEEKLNAVNTKEKGEEEPAASAAAQTLDDDGELEEDDDRYGDELDMPGQKFDSKQRQSIRNLRIREDTAKYLFNLDPNSAYYDPKTRAMRENPFENTGKPESEVPFAGDNFVRNDGDAPGMLDRQVFAWDMHNKLGLDLHLQADPTRLEMLAKKVSTAKNQVQSHIREEILDRYGGREHFDAPPRDVLFGQWESYAEYTPTGRVLKGIEKPTVKSRYEEDVYLSNHKAVWGSYWYAGQWGFACCHSLIKESYCTGSKGKSLSLPEAPEKALCSSILAPVKLPNPENSDNENHTLYPSTCLPKKKSRKHFQSSNSDNSENDRRSETFEERNIDIDHASLPNIDIECAHNEGLEKVDLLFEKNREAERLRSSSRRENIRNKRSKKRKKHSNLKRQMRKRSKLKDSLSLSRSSSLSCSNASKDSEDEIQAKESRVLIAIEKEKKRIADVNRFLAMDERDRPYNSMTEVHKPTEEEMEAFFRTRKNPNDPMSNFTY